MRSTKGELMIGALVAAQTMVGRWTPFRLTSTTATHSLFYTEPRFWLSAMALLLLFVPVNRHAGDFAPNRAPTRRADWLFLWIMVFLGYMILSAFWATNTPLAVYKAYELGLIVAMLAPLGKWMLAGDSAAVRSSFWRWFCLASGALALLGMLSVGGGFYGEGMRLSVLAGGPNAYGRMMGLLALGSLYFAGKGGIKLIWYPLAAVAMILVVLSGSRGAMLAMGAGGNTWFLGGVLRSGTRRKVIVATVMLAATAGIIGLTSLGALANSVFTNRITLLLSEERNLSGRETIYQDAFQMGFDHMLCGAGLNAFLARDQKFYPHNLFLEAWSEGGAIGLGLMGLLVLVYVRYALKMWTRLDIPTVAACLLALVFSQASGDLFDTRVFFFLLILSTVSPYEQSRIRDESGTESSPGDDQTASRQ